MGKHEFNAAVLLGCVAGTLIVALAWALALGLAEVERCAPGAGWALAGVALMALYAFARLLWVMRLGGPAYRMPELICPEDGAPCDGCAGVRDPCPDARPMIGGES